MNFQRRTFMSLAQNSVGIFGALKCRNFWSLCVGQIKVPRSYPITRSIKHASAVGQMSKGRVVKSIEQTWCRASKSAWGDGKFATAMLQLLSSTPVLEIALQPLYFILHSEITCLLYTSPSPRDS